MLRYSTWNVFWLGTPEVSRIRRAPEDEALLVDALSHLDADAILFQEIVSVPLLETLLRRAGARSGRDYRVRDTDGRFLTTGRMRSRTSHIQKLVLAYDGHRLDLVEQLHPWNDRSWPGPRAPLAALLRDRQTGFTCTVVSVHLKSGSPGEPSDAPSAVTRASECAALVTWLLGASRHEGGRGGPPTDDVAVLGDWNAVREHPSMRPLGRIAPPWTFHQPIWQPDDPHERWTSYTSHTVVDHSLTSPSLTPRVLHVPRVYAFDLDPAFDLGANRASGPGGGASSVGGEVGLATTAGTHYMHQRTGFAVELEDSEQQHDVPNLFRISDHRPLSLDLRV